MFSALVCSAMRTGDLVLMHGVPVLRVWLCSVLRFARALCHGLRCFILLELPALRVGDFWLCGAGGVRDSC